MNMLLNVVEITFYCVVSLIIELLYLLYCVNAASSESHGGAAAAEQRRSASCYLY